MGSGPDGPATFDRIREKVRRFFNFESNRFYSDIQAFDSQGRGTITLGDLFYYLEFNLLKLTKEEQKCLMDKFKAVNSTPVPADYLTSMIFEGHARTSIISQQS